MLLAAGAEGAGASISSRLGPPAAAGLAAASDCSEPESLRLALGTDLRLPATLPPFFLLFFFSVLLSLSSLSESSLLSSSLEEGVAARFFFFFFLGSWSS